MNSIGIPYICNVNSIGSIQYDAIKWCWHNSIEVYSQRTNNSDTEFRIVVDMGAIDMKVSEGTYHIDIVDSKVWELYIDIYLKGVSN